jgi:hypothetical protein
MLIYLNKVVTMQSATDKLQEYFNELMNFSDTAVTSQEEQILLAGAMMGVAKCCITIILPNKNMIKL